VLSANPKGLQNKAQGCRPRLPWVGVQKRRNPEEVGESTLL